jgi:hypothetical protein
MKKRILKVSILFLLLAAFAYSADDDDKKELLRKSSFAIDVRGTVLNFVLLHNKSVEALFSGPSKYSIRARANESTVFYIYGTAKKDIKFEPWFEVVQNNVSFQTKAININNFKAGPVDKGSRIEGLIELGGKINLYQPFSIKDSYKVHPEFQYDYEVVEMIEGKE